MSYTPTHVFGTRHRGSFDDTVLKNAMLEPLAGTQSSTHIELQHCRRCCNPELVVVTRHRTDDTDIMSARLIALQMSAPLCIISYDAHDKKHAGTIDLLIVDENGTVVKNDTELSWDAFTSTRVWARKRTSCYDSSSCITSWKYLKSRQMESGVINIGMRKLARVGKSNSTSDSIVVNFVHRHHIDVDDKNEGRSRQMDFDAVQTCASCGKVEAFVEATSDEKKFMTNIRYQAHTLNAMTILVRHHQGDEDNSHDTDLGAWGPNGEVIRDITEATWGDFQAMRVLAHAMHLQSSSSCSLEDDGEALGSWLESSGIPVMITDDIMSSL